MFAYIAAYNAASGAGYIDWRAPNVREVQCLLDMEAPSAIPNSVAFPDFTTGMAFYTSTTESNASGNACILNSTTNGRFSGGGKAGAYLIMLVRG
jgi:hypothetical protein